MILYNYFLFSILFFAPSILFSQNNCGIIEIENEHESYALFVSMINEVNTQTFNVTNNLNDIPQKVKEQLDCFFNDLDMANYKEDFNGSCTVEKRLHSRGLTYLALNENYLLISYSSSGGSGYHMWFKYNENGVLKSWFCGSLGRVPTNKKLEFEKYLKMVEHNARMYTEVINQD